MKKLKLSICLITKNEEECIADCIKSVLPIADEIIVLDTGSTDNTREICLAFNSLIGPLPPAAEENADPELVKVYEAAWEDNFSTAKNEAISYATGDWVLSLSANDRLPAETAEKLPGFLRSMHKQPFWDRMERNDILDDEGNINFGIIIKFLMIEFNDSGDMSEQYLIGVLFNNGKGIHYIRPIHEMLTGEDVIELDCSFLTINHAGLQKKSIELFQKREKYIDIMLKEINDHPELESNHFYYYHLGLAYLQNKMPDKALEAYYQAYHFYNRVKNPENNYSYYTTILSDLVFLLVFYKNDYRQALTFINIMLELGPKLPDALFFMGYCQQKLGYYQKAIYFYMQSLFSLERLKTNWTGISAMLLQLPLELRLAVAKCYMMLGNNQLALDLLQEAETRFPNDLQVQAGLFRYFLLTGEFSKVVDYYHKFSDKITSSEKEQLDKLLLSEQAEADYQQNLVKIMAVIELSTIKTNPYFSSTV